MKMLDSLFGHLGSLAPTAVTLLIAILVLAIAGRVLERRRIRTGGAKIGKQVALTLLGLGGLLAVLLVLPISDTARGQIISLLGIVISASIALSSGTLVSNAMAGVIIRVVGRRLNIGDMVVLEGHSGRITELGLFAAEIQTRDRNLTWIPNQWIIDRPSTLMRPSGTIISTQVSLSYALNRSRVEPLLVGAAEAAGLENAFAYVQELGNHAVTYTVRGFLTDVTQLLQARAQLRARVLDTLHEADIEIVSPVHEMGRRMAEDEAILPDPEARRAGGAVQAQPDHVMFDRAQAKVERAQRAEEVRGQLAKLEAESRVASDLAQKSRLRNELRRLERELRRLES
jgi:small-conductance mechanosensitive channel